MIKVCVAGVTGWTGSAVAKSVLQSDEFQLVSAVSRKAAGKDVGEVLGLERNGVIISSNVESALSVPVDVFVEYTHASSVKEHVITAIKKDLKVVIGSSGLSSNDYAEIESLADERKVGVVAAGNFSLTAALAKRFSLMAAEFLPQWEIIDYADSHKVDAPSGTTYELAEKMSKVKTNKFDVPIESVLGIKEARGASINGVQVHSVRLPGYKISFETIFGLPDERLAIRHDAGSSAQPYVQGTLLAIRRVMTQAGLVRGLDVLLFPS